MKSLTAAGRDVGATRAGVWAAFSIAAVVGLLAAGGCSSESQSSSVSGTTRPSARAVLDQMVEAYQHATSYADTGEVQLRLKLDGQPIESNFPWSVAVERPNRLRMHVYGANIVSDGREFWAHIEALAGQILRRESPKILTTESIYASEAIAQELIGGIASAPLSLALFLDDQPLTQVLSMNAAEPPQLLTNDKIDDRPCQRVAIRRKDGELIFWIDLATRELRRIEYPLNELRQSFSHQGKVTDLSLVAELKGARLGAKFDEAAFKFEAPAEARQVKEFVLRPKPEPPSVLLGKRVEEFTLARLDGEPVTRELLNDSVVVLDFWSAHAPICLESLTITEQVRAKFQGRERVAFLAVNVDPLPNSPAVPGFPPLSDEEVEKRFSATGVKLRLLRDRKQLAASVFDIRSLPCQVILGTDGTVEDVRSNVARDLPETLPGRIEKLLVGGHLHTDAKKRYDEQLRDYEAQFATPGAPVNAPRVDLAPAAVPQRLRLEQRWQNQEVLEPGNLLVVPATEGPKLLVVSGRTSIVELDATGAVVARHEIQAAGEPVPTTSVRTAQAAGGQRFFATFAVGQTAVQLFDAAWQHKLTYPSTATAGGVADVLFDDLNDSGQPELTVAFYDVVGVHQVALHGGRVWANRSLGDFFSLTPAPPIDGRRGLWCGHVGGTIGVIDSSGKEAAPIKVPNRFLRLIRSAEFATQARHWCALATTEPGKDTLVGLSAEGRELWSYPLPEGLHSAAALDPIAAATVDGKSAWIAAAADGSIHVVGVDGEPIDRWSTGNVIMGLTATDARLFIASPTNVTAYDIAR